VHKITKLTRITTRDYPYNTSIDVGARLKVVLVPSGGNLQAIEKSDFFQKSDFFALINGLEISAFLH